MKLTFDDWLLHLVEAADDYDLREVAEDEEITYTKFEEVLRRFHGSVESPGSSEL